jgi:exopolysaccharide production protein ExoZ
LKDPGFLPRIESLRGIAALMVVGYHVNSLLSGTTSALFANGIGAVVTFFVLSGFVLARSLDANIDPIRFLKNRFWRLFPAAAAAVLLLTWLHWQFGMFVGYEASFDVFNVVLNMLMIKSDINGVMWSMTVECAAAPLVLFSVWLYRERGQIPLWGLASLLFAFSFWGAYVHLLGGFTNLASFYSFVIGVLIHFRGKRFAESLPEGPAIVAAIIVICVFCYCGLKKQTAPILALECICAATVILLIAWRPTMALFKPLDLKLVRFYGQISYSFYLLHPLGILFAFRFIKLTTLPLQAEIIFMTMSAVLLTTPAAYLSWRFIESPGLSGRGSALAVR